MVTCCMCAIMMYQLRHYMIPRKTTDWLTFIFFHTPSKSFTAQFRMGHVCITCTWSSDWLVFGCLAIATDLCNRSASISLTGETDEQIRLDLWNWKSGWACDQLNLRLNLQGSKKKMVAMLSLMLSEVVPSSLKLILILSSTLNWFHFDPSHKCFHRQHVTIPLCFNIQGVPSQELMSAVPWRFISSWPSIATHACTWLGM